MNENILHITASRGGVEHYVNAIISKSNKYNHHIVKTEDFTLSDNINSSSFVLNIIQSDNFNIFYDLKNIYKIIINIRNYHHKFNLLHAHSSKGTIYACFIGLYFNLPVLVSPHSFGYLKFIGIKRRIVFIIENLFSKIFKYHLLVSSNGEKKIAQDLFYIKNRFICDGYRNSIEVSRYKKNNHNTEKIKIISVGRMTYQKNPELFFHISKKILEKYDNVKFIFIGAEFNNKVTKEEQQLIKNNKNQIDIISWLPKNKLIKTMQEADIYLSTSRYEGLPTVLLFALDYELPIVCTKVIGNNDLVINGYNGFSSNNTEQLVNDISILINNLNLRKKYGKNGKQLVRKKYNLNHNIFHLNEIYHNIIK